MGRFYRTDIDIYYIDEYGEHHPLPFAFYASKPRFGWTLPEGVSQTAFIFEMRTRYPKSYTVLGEPVFTSAYLYSGAVQSPFTEYECYKSITYNPDTQQIIGTWHGSCEVRLRIFDANGNEYCTHGKLPSGSPSYAWELMEDGTPNRQNRLWGSQDDRYYFCFDPDIDDRRNIDNAVIQFSNLLETTGSGYTYTFQISDTPLFDEGLSHIVFHEVSGISNGNLGNGVEVSFSDASGTNPNASPTALPLSYGEMYYYRTRSYDGSVYSEWCAVNSIRAIRNAVPTCTIISTSVPDERPNGEVSVTIRVDDADTQHVKAWLMFSMPIESESVASVLGADLNPYVGNSPPPPLMAYGSDNAGKYIRAVTKESLIRIPTNTDIELTWCSVTDTTRDVMAGTTLRHVYLYLFATDGASTTRSAAYPPSSAATPTGMTVDNSRIGRTETPDTQSDSFHVRGDITWMLKYPVLPDTMQRALMPHTLDESSGDGEEESSENSGATQTGCIGYIDGNGLCDIGSGSSRVTGSYHNWYDLYSLIENTLGYGYLQRTTQQNGFTVHRYNKYSKYYGSSSLYAGKYGDFVPRGEGEPVTFYPDGNGNESTDSRYAHEDTIECDGFVSFCPHCNELHILRTIIRLPDGRVFRDTYSGGEISATALVNAFGSNGERFDGTSYELMFECAGCGSIYPMSTRYQTHMASGVFGAYMKESYAYWHGYNSDLRIQDNGALQQQLKLTRKRDYERLVEEWKRQWKIDHNSQTDPKDEDCPYKWVELKREDGSPLMQYGGTSEASSDNDDFNAERFGLMPDDALLNLDPRPEFDAYMKVIAPDAKSYREWIYNDGSKLNASIELDYMHDFETKGEGQNRVEGDKALVRLAKQGPWWVQDRMMYQFFEGRKSIKSQKEGYVGANSYGEEEEDDSSEQSSSSADEPTGIKEYRVCALASVETHKRNGGTERYNNDGVAVVETQNRTDGTWISTLVSRMSCSGNARFPIMIERGVNDRFEYVVNDEQRVEGSVLPDGVDAMFIAFPYKDGREDTEHSHEMLSEDEDVDFSIHTYIVEFNEQEKSKFLSVLRKLFSPVFSFDFRDEWGTESIPFLKEFTYTMKNGLQETIQNAKEGRNVDVVAKSLSFTLYGDTSLDVDGLRERRYSKFELVDCESNCYEALGIVPYVTHQSARDFIGRFNRTDGSVSLLKKGEFPSNPDIREDLPPRKENEDADDTYTYYYTERNTTKHEYYVEESPVDNDIEDFLSYTEEREGYAEPLNVKFRKPSETRSQGEPLFTCYKDEVDENGYHFKYTPEDYRKTGKIYIRRYHVETCNPFPMEGFGYRNWIVVPIEGKEGRYRKKQVFNTRGACAVPREIQVEVSSGEPLVTEIGWFPSENENAEPFSHDRSSSEEGQQSEDRIYKRKGDYTWRNEMTPKTCVVFDYVDVSQALCKNPFTPEGESPLNHICPINFSAGIYKDIIVDRYGLYVLGGYDLTEQQKGLQDDGVPYLQDFTYIDDETGIETTVTESLPNNWRPMILDSVFDTIEDEARSVTVIDLTEKNPSSDSENPADWNKPEYGTKTVGTYERYKKAWEGVVPTPANPPRELSQQTVEQFNPAFKGHFGIWEKYGYQPKNTTQQYFREDEDGMYKGKYIPLSSKLVHGIYRDPITGEKGDPYADYRLVGEIMTERHIISDKTFMKVDDTYDKLPFLDYRIVGKCVYELLPYFSGYPRSEHPAYATRPEPPYPYDRQWRIGGWRMFERDSFQRRKEEGETFDMTIGSGAQIGELADYSSVNAFLYLQGEWNSYNRLHWTLDVGSSVYLCLVAQKRNSLGENVGAPFSVKTYGSFWKDGISINQYDSGAWCIKYDESLSDMVDMTATIDQNGNCKFEDGEPYVFMLRAFTENGDGEIGEASIPVTSRQFSISPTAVSPATIIGTDYDPWTKILTIEFRFDDALGRDYDIVGFQYVENDYTFELQNGQYSKVYKSENEFVTPGDPDGNGTGVLMGNLLNLASNMRSDSMADELLVTHTVQVNIADLGITSTSNMRVKLLSALSADRAGLTLPVFTVKMWANEFLKPVEEQILSLQGYKTNWKWVETYDEATGKVEGSWKYVDDDNAVTTLGKIQETKESIRRLSDTFEQWYGKACKFCPASAGDLDSFEMWMKSGSEWDSFYYGYFFMSYMVSHMDDGYYSDFVAYASSVKSSVMTTKAKKWLQARGHSDEYESWYQGRRLFILSSYKDGLASEKLSRFQSSVKQASPLPEAHVAFAKTRIDEYMEYFGIEQSSSGSSEEPLVVLPADALDFIEGSNLQQSFISFYAKDNLYADTRFLERALAMCRLFGIQTVGVWEQVPASPAYAGEYETWLASDAALSSLPLSDRYQMFLSFALNDQLKTQILPAYSPEATIVEEGYAASALISDAGDASVAKASNGGRSLAFATWLQSPSGNGSTYSQKWQALNNTLSQQRKLLTRCLNEKNMLETDFRKDLIRQGYFCNGFLENQPYDGENVNTCFRWRVETRQYEGKMDASYDSNSRSYGSYDERYDMYYHFQMDFFDTFNSQDGGKPMMDIVFIKDGLTDDCRILAGIDDADNSARTSPIEGDKTEDGNYVPQRQELVIDRTENELAQHKSDRNIADLQFTATFGLPKDELPKTGNGISLPEPWRMSWRGDAPWEEAPDEESYIESNSDYKGTYYWRVAPYNLLDRPCFDAMLGSIQRSGDSLTIASVFHSDQISEAARPDRLWYATSRLSCPVWKRNAESAPIGGSSQYRQTTWLNGDAEARGDVQFITDRPRKVDYVSELVEEQGDVESFLVSNQSGYTRLPDNLCGSYIGIGGDVFSKNDTYYIYKATMDGNQHWFIGTEPSQVETNDGSWLYIIDHQYPELASQVLDRNGNGIPASLFASYGSGESATVSHPSLSFIKDNIGNFDTQWIPPSPERRKPFVIRFQDQYLLFSHKKTGTAVNNGVSYPQNVITMSRGFSSDVFGEERMCIPSYTFESAGDYARDGDRKAVSMENPCVVGLADGVWRMYFNAVFFDGVRYYSKIYKADTADFESWLGISEVAVMVNGVQKTDYYQPNVTVKYSGSTPTFEMYAASLDHYYAGNEGDATEFTTIKRLSSTDGLSFTFVEELHESSDNEYNFCSPFLLDSGGIRKLYFTIESARNPQTSSVVCVIGSFEWDGSNGRWNTNSYLGMSRVVLEMSDDPFGANVVSGLGRIFNGFGATTHSYMNPCVIRDYFNGCPVLRMYYNTYDKPFAYDSGVIGEVDGLSELVMRTGYLEEWSWGNTQFPSQVVLPASVDGSETAVFSVPSQCGSATLFMARILPRNSKVRCMAQGRWIGYDNAALTEAILLPETNNEIGYSLEKYSPVNWIVENELDGAYNSWRGEQASSNELALEWLMETRNYPRYLWWSRKGAGIYRYVGYDVVKDYGWKGVERETP